MYQPDCGLIFTTFEGLLKNYDQLTFKPVWEHFERHHALVDKRHLGTNIEDEESVKFTMTLMDYSVKNGYLAVGGIEGVLLVYDMISKLQVT
jgi:hypothetical protein